MSDKYYKNKELYQITKKFVESLFKEYIDNSSYNNYIKRPFKYKNREFPQKNKTITLNLSKDKIMPYNKHLVFQTTGKKKINKNSNNNDTNSNNKIYCTEKTKKSTTSDYFPSTTRQTGKNNINKDYYNTINTTSSNSNSSTYEIYKAKQESLKEKKLYEERVKILRNHINALKKQEEELNKKAEFNKEREKNINKRKKEKDCLKQALLSAEIDKRNALEEKKKKYFQQKLKNILGLKKSQERIIKQKNRQYREAYKDRRKIEEIRNEINNKIDEKNSTQFKKIRNEREKLKDKNNRKNNEDITRINNSYRITYQKNINEAQKLKNELKNLELMEEECIEKLKKTQDYIKKNNGENIRFNNYERNKYNITFDNNTKRKANSVKRRNYNNDINYQKRDVKGKGFSLSKSNLE